jgi:predicted kinase
MMSAGMSSPILVVVTGPPASGKSTIARDLATELSIPFLSKDELKERVYEELGSGEQVEPVVERSALAILYSVARSNLTAGVSVLLESNFDRESDTAPLRDLEARIVQVHFGGDAEELARAFAERAAEGKRHEGHDDDPDDAAEVRHKIEAGFWDPLDLPGELIRVDTTADDVDAEALAADPAFA